MCIDTYMRVCIPETLLKTGSRRLDSRVLSLSLFRAKENPCGCFQTHMLMHTMHRKCLHFKDGCRVVQVGLLICSVCILVCCTTKPGAASCYDAQRQIDLGNTIRLADLIHNDVILVMSRELRLPRIRALSAQFAKSQAGFNSYSNKTSNHPLAMNLGNSDKGEHRVGGAGPQGFPKCLAI